MYCDLCDAELSGFEEEICKDCADEENVKNNPEYTRSSIQNMQELGCSKMEIWDIVTSDQWVDKTKVKKYFDVDEFLREKEAEMKTMQEKNLQVIEGIEISLLKVDFHVTRSVLIETMNDYKEQNDYLDVALERLKTLGQLFD